MSIVATFDENSTKVYTKSIYQYDKGQKLTFEGLDIPDGCEVHFSNMDDASGFSVVQKYNAEHGVYIPDGLLQTGMYIYAWLCARKRTTGSRGDIDYHVDADENFSITRIEASKSGSEMSETLFHVIIPVIQRPAPVRVNSDYDYTDGIDEERPMEYAIADENLQVLDTGNDGNGFPSLRNYKVDGERLIFT